MCVLLVVGTLFASDAGLGSHQEVTVDFSTHGEGIFDPTFYEPQGLVFPPLICGSTGCHEWFVSGFFAGDAALVRDAPDA